MNMKKIQKHLVEKEILPQRVLADKDTGTFSNKVFRQAVETVTDQYKGLEILLTEPQKCVRLVREKISSSFLPEHDKLIYASILCILGDKEYADILVDKIRSYPLWDEGWHYTASAQFGECMSPLDSLIIALGNTKDETILPIILEKAELLKPEDYFSHFRAIAMACEAIGSQKAIPVLYRLLTYEGMRYNDLPSYTVAREKTIPYIHDVTYRNRILKELHLAKSLYLCGDQNQTAEKVLRRYAEGLEGHYARFANEILTT